MSEWRGLHNPERHEPYAGQFAGYAECLPVLGGCLAECGEDDPCRCCLAAEVERLTEAVGHLRKVETDLTAALAERDRRIRKAIEALGNELPESTGYMRVDAGRYDPGMDMVEFAQEHGWQVGSKIRFRDREPASEVTSITRSGIHIATPGDFPGCLTAGSVDGSDWSLVDDDVVEGAIDTEVITYFGRRGGAGMSGDSVVLDTSGNGRANAERTESPHPGLSQGGGIRLGEGAVTG